MGARLPLVIVGGVLMFVSILLPTLYWNVHTEAFGVELNGALYYWMYGLLYAIITAKSEYSDIEYTSRYTEFRPDMLGIICMMIIITGAIVTLVLGCATEKKAAFVGGVLGLAGMIAYYVGVIMALRITRTYQLVEAGFYPIPFLGFYVCIVGGILAFVGGLLERY